MLVFCILCKSEIKTPSFTQVIQSLASQRPAGSRSASRPSSRVAARAASPADASPSSSKSAAKTTNAADGAIPGIDKSGTTSSMAVCSTSSSKAAPGSKHMPQSVNKHAAFGSSVEHTVKTSSLAAVGRAEKQPAADLCTSTARPAGTAGSSATSGRTRSGDISGSRGSAVKACLDTAQSSPETAKSTSKAGSLGKLDPKLSSQKTFRFEDVQEEDEELQAAVRPAMPLLSEASLTHKIVQQLDFTGSHHDDHHLFLEVSSECQFRMKRKRQCFTSHASLCSEAAYM